jgi:hypothetical protein
MSTARDLLDCLGRSTLVRLIQERALSTSRENDERRKTLAHSYRGDQEALVHDLNRAELVLIFRKLTFFIGGEEFYLSNPAKYRLEELRAFAIRAFAGRRVHIVGEFSPASELDENEAFELEDEPEDGEAEPEDDVDAGAADDENDQNAVPRESEESSGGQFGHLTDEWSRPRLISRVLQELGRDVPFRLRAARFRELISDLRARGIEACHVDDPSWSVLTDDAESPGIAAKLRLRIADSGKGLASRVRPGTHGEAAPSVSARKAWESRRAHQPTEGGPPIVIQPGEPPVSQRIPRPSDYNIAVLRLQFLTAVPSVERGRMAEWPSGYLAAATQGLDLRPPELALLRAYATGLCLGNHSPYDAIPHLTQAMSAEEWERLLSDFVALNPFQPDFVRAIVEQIRPIAAPKSEAETWHSAVPLAEDLHDVAPADAPVQEPLAAAGKHGTTTSESPKDSESNVRNLGSLSGMFEEK